MVLRADGLPAVKVVTGAAIVAASAVITFTALAALFGFRTQTFPSVDAAGTCPPDEELARLNPEIDGSVRSQRQRTGSPVRPDLPLYRNSSLTGPRVEKPPSGYDDNLIVMVGAGLGMTGPALVRRIRDDVCGWMEVGDLERSATPQKHIQLPGFDNVVDNPPAVKGVRRRFDGSGFRIDLTDQSHTKVVDADQQKPLCSSQA
jgi:hypothetical protein